MGAFVSTSVAPPPWVDRVITIVFLASPSDLTLEVFRLGRCLDSATPTQRHRRITVGRTERPW
ncbi:MAG TPA: hypothetical protein VFB94_21555 [Acidimicrobiales bacterium]|nr:hypothetical protein [Acidimicrobiales bacterium]